jgi:hypothetical protein
MSLYVAEFQFRYNNRENADIFGAAYGKWAGAIVILLGLAGWIAVLIFGTPLAS